MTLIMCDCTVSIERVRLIYNACGNTYFFLLQPTVSAKSQSILITPGNVRYLAHFIASSATINSRSIRFTTGTGSEKLLQVPIAAAGELDAHTSIRVTIGLTPVIGDSDPSIGISDGINVNTIYILDTGNYPNRSPCFVVDGSHEDRRVTTRRISSHFTFLFSPFYKYGACSSAQDGGYLNVGTFNKQVDPTKGLSLVVYRDGLHEQYKFSYFLVETLQA